MADARGVNGGTSSDEAIGIDLAGPTNTGDTALVRLRDRPQAGELQVVEILDGASDDALRRAIEEGPSGTVVGLDAPLSYQPGGGLRPADVALREELDERGFANRYVLPPTMTRMIYLTARGMTIARQVRSGSARIVETHPTAALLFRGVAERDVRDLKESRAARYRVLEAVPACLEGSVPEGLVESDHLVSALGAALAARDAGRSRSEWTFSSDPPVHPFPVVC